LLTSVQKTEESLRRLKNLRERSANNLSAMAEQRTGAVMSDDDKIRLQLHVDVIHWTQEVEKFGLDRATVTKLPDLVRLVEEATKIRVLPEDK
jgi:conserved oligomeric Golgi complex subunit 2